MNILSFAFFIWVFTSFQKLSWGLVFAFWAILLLVLSLIFVQEKKKMLKSWLLALVLGFWGAMISCLFFWWKGNPQLLPDFFTFSFYSPVQEQVSSTIVKDFVVLEQTKPDRYIVQGVENEKSYLLKTQQYLQLGNVYTIGANLKNLDLSQTYGERFFVASWSLLEQVQDFLSYEFSFEKWMLMKGYAGSLFPKFIVPIDQDFQFSWLEKQLIAVRSFLKGLIQEYFPDRNWGLLLGMMIGDRSGLENQEYQDFITSGMVHIIAVSGGNLIMIIVFLGGVLFWLPFYLRNVLIILWVVAFALVAGGDSSIVRALIMTVLSLLALFRGREVEIWRLMKYAFVLMLFWNPYFLAYDLGFLLSFGALIGIVLYSQFVDSWSEKKKKVRFQFLFSFWKNYWTPTIGAMLGTLPVLLFFIGKTNLVGTLVNLLVVPLVPFITIGGFIALFLASITWWSRILFPVKRGLDLMFFFSELAVKYAVSLEVSVMWMKWLFFIILSLILWCFWKIIKDRSQL